MMTDIVYELIDNPFSRRSDTEKRLILDNGRPTPLLSSVIHTLPAKGTRKFNPSWYETHKWLTGSETKAKLYCWPCLLLSCKEGTWNRNGFFDMKNLSKAIHKHEASKEHIFSIVNLKRLEKNFNPISEMLSEQHRIARQQYNKKVEKNRKIMRRLIDVAVLLCKRELSFRGHIEIVTRMMQYDDDLRQHWEELEETFTGLSKSIQNDLIYCIHEEIITKIKTEIKEAPFFSVQCDDTTDLSEVSQLSVIVKYIDKAGVVQDRFLGFHSISTSRKAFEICDKLLEVLREFNIKDKLIGHCYDGASVMAGEISCLQTLVKRHAPQALFTHCCAHRLNLVLQNGAKTIKDVRIFFSNLQGFPAYFLKSVKRAAILDKVVGKRIPTASEVCWSSYTKILDMIYNHREELITVFCDIEEDPLSSPESINAAIALKNHLQNMTFVFLLTVFRDIFSVTEILFDILQKKSLDTPYCFSAIHEQIRKFQDMRNDDQAEKYFNTVNVMENMREVRDISNGNLIQYRKLYFEIVDNIIFQLQTRYRDIQNLEFLSLADSSRFNVFRKCFPAKELVSLQNYYAMYFDLSRLRNELEFIYSDDQFLSGSVTEVIKLFVESDIQSVLPEAYKLFTLAATIPSTSCSVERSLSCLSRVKSYLRSTMGQDRVTALATASIERELLHSLEKQETWYDDVIKRYASMNELKDRRIDLLYK